MISWVEGQCWIFYNFWKEIIKDGGRRWRVEGLVEGLFFFVLSGFF